MNYMEQVAKMLGVELGEEFEVVGNEETYVIEEDGLTETGMRRFDNFVLRNVLNGAYTIKRKPWKPKHGEYYFGVDFSSAGLWFSTNYSEGNIFDESRIKHGTVFRTKEEAIEAANKMLKALEVVE